MKAVCCDTFECRQTETQKCCVCKKSYYCSVEHQKQEWAKHKLVCKLNDTVDGYELCSMLLKANELIDFSMAGTGLAGVNINVEENVIEITLEKNVNGLVVVDSPESYGAKEKNEKRAYWAVRSMNSVTVMPFVLDSVLKLLRDNGYKFLLFRRGDGQTVKLSLRNPFLKLWSIKPTIKVKCQGLYNTRENPENNVVHMTNVLDGHVIDLTAARFWCFDEEERPMILTPTRMYLSFIGEVGKKTERIDEIIEREHKKQHIRMNSAGILKLIYERLGYEWLDHLPSRLLGVETDTQAEKLSKLQIIGDQTMIDVMKIYLTSEHIDTPVTRILKGIHEQSVSSETNEAIQ